MFSVARDRLRLRVTDCVMIRIFPLFGESRVRIWFSTLAAGAASFVTIVGYNPLGKASSRNYRVCTRVMAGMIKCVLDALSQRRTIPERQPHNGLKPLSVLILSVLINCPC